MSEAMNNIEECYPKVKDAARMNQLAKAAPRGFISASEFSFRPHTNPGVRCCGRSGFLIFGLRSFSMKTRRTPG